MSKDKSGGFGDFVSLCRDIQAKNGLHAKTKVVKDFLASFDGDTYLLFKFLLPKFDKRVYNLKDRKIVKLFSEIFNEDFDEMNDDLNLGDIAETLSKFFKQSKMYAKKSSITLGDVDNFLEKLTKITKQDEQMRVLEKFVAYKLTPDDLKYVTRLIVGDLRIAAGSASILKALHPDAYQVFKITQNLKEICDKISSGQNLAQLSQSNDLASPTFVANMLDEMNSDDDDDKKIENREKESDDQNESNGESDDNSENEEKPKKKGKSSKTSNTAKEKKKKKSITIKLKPLTHVAPMLARASNSVEDALKRCPNGFFAEIKYDGERIMIHKDGDNFKFFSRSGKDIVDYKVKDVKDYIMKSVSAKQVILDGEILMVDKNTGELLPFVTLSKSKKSKMDNAIVCIFIFDIIYLEGRNLMELPIETRRKLLEKTLKVQKNKVHLSEATICKGNEETKEALLSDLMNHVIKHNYEGLMLKDLQSVYEPKARHWIKMKKDYMDGMADSVDLLVLGAYYGTGIKGGIMSVFLMGVYDESEDIYKTVCKACNGHEHGTLEKLNKYFEPLMNKISGDPDKLPDWLDCNRSLVPDFVIKDPKSTQVWEIVGAEFSISKVHSANYSVRFPRITAIRTDKSHDDSTSMKEFLELVKSSKSSSGNKIMTKVSTSKSAKKRPRKKREEDDEDDDDDGDDLKDFIVDDDDDIDDDDEISSKKRRTNDTRKKKPIDSDNDDMARKEDDDEEEEEEDDGPDPELDYIYGDFTSPVNKSKETTCILVHSVDDRGKWATRGPMQLISQVFGDEPQKTYEKQQDDVGALQMVKVTKGDKPAYICTIIGQKFFANKSSAPPINYTFLERALKDIFKFIKKQNGRFSVHFSRFHRSVPNLSTKKVDRMLYNTFVKNSIPTYVYTRDNDDKEKCKSTTRRMKERRENAANAQNIQKFGGKTDDKMLLDDGEKEKEKDADMKDGINQAMMASSKKAKNELLFENINVVISGYSPEETKRIRDMVMNSGGTVQTKWEMTGNKSTHLICDTFTHTYDQVSGMGGIIVSKKWIEQSISEAKLLDVNEYKFPQKEKKNTLTHQQYDKQHGVGDERTEKEIQKKDTTTIRSSSRSDATSNLSNKGQPPGLIDIFTGCCFLLYGEVIKKRQVMRNLIAFDGDAVEEYSEDCVTHIITDGKWDSKLQQISKDAPEIRIIKSSYVWACVSAGKKVPVRDHLL